MISELGLGLIVWVDAEQNLCDECGTRTRRCGKPMARRVPKCGEDKKNLDLRRSSVELCSKG